MSTVTSALIQEIEEAAIHPQEACGMLRSAALELLAEVNRLEYEHQLVDAPIGREWHIARYEEETP